MKIQRVCVYCASSTKIPQPYLDSAYELGKILANNNITTIYGGGSVGSMGALAEGVLDHGGKITGIIPKFMMDLEWGNQNVDELIVVDTMAERKRQFIDNVDAVIALPGGTGTLEELCEVMSLKKLGLFLKPVVIVNTNNFYDPFLDMIQGMVKDNFIRIEHTKIYSVVSDVIQVIDTIRNSPDWPKSSINLAAL